MASSCLSAPLQVQFYTLELLLIAGFFIGFSCGFRNSNEIAPGDVNDPLIKKLDVRSFGQKDDDVARQCDNPSLLLTRNVGENFIDGKQINSFRPTRTTGFRRSKHNISFHRKLLTNSNPSSSCSVADLSLTQGFSGYSNGIPAYTVQIVNLCLNPSCDLRNIHVACAAFSSSRPLDTLVFQRLSYNDCFVMNGAPLRAGDSVTFDYANSSEYPMYIISAEVGPCTPP